MIVGNCGWNAEGELACDSAAAVTLCEAVVGDLASGFGT